ncbi:uncharacterized protein LOC120073674 [Benincasa hispida]|uniref:uncharacterized protein LOC120073674 n=1 Tax=Benincasa hispida TaxID=102211 RepID=UPI00190249C4|nr:uncharacterized protein LOC120073674 [Benincasa hispida]
MRNYAASNLYDFSPGIARPTVDDNARFEIKPIMLQMIQNVGQFGGMQGEDPHAYLTSFVEKCNTFLILGVTLEGIRLSLFPYTLRDEAKKLTYSLEPNEIVSWDQLVERATQEIADASIIVASWTRHTQRLSYGSWNVKKKEDRRGNKTKRYGELISRSDGVVTSLLQTMVINQSALNRNVAQLNTMMQVAVHKGNPLGFHQQPQGHQPHQSRNQYNHDQASSSNALSSLEAFLKEYIQKNDALIQSQATSIRIVELQVGQFANGLKTRQPGSLPSNFEAP